MIDFFFFYDLNKNNKGHYSSASKNRLLSTLPPGKVNSGSKMKDVMEEIRRLLPTELQQKIEKCQENGPMGVCF